MNSELVAMKRAAFALFFAVLSSAYKVDVIDDAEKKKHEHPKFSLTDDQPKDHSYQVRRYATSLWTSTMVKGYSEENAKKVGFKRLFDYIRGDNDRGIELDITVPFVTAIQASPCVFCRSSFIMSFYVPSIYHNNPPLPKNKYLFMEKGTPVTVYVKEFSGEVNPNLSKYVAYQLSCDLQRNNVTKSKVESHYMLLSEYGNPLSGWHRRNEIWLPQRNRNFKSEIDGFGFSKDP